MLNTTYLANTYINTTCIINNTTSGNARSDNCQSFNVIIAIPRNNDRLIPPTSLISPMCILNFPVYSSIFLISAAAIMAPMYTGNVMPVSVRSFENIVPIPTAIINWNTAIAYILVCLSCFFSSSTKRLSSSGTTVDKRFFFSISFLPIGPPIRLPATSPNVAAAVQIVVAPDILKSSKTGPNAPAVPCPPTIGMEPVHIPINLLSPNREATPTAKKFCANIRTTTNNTNTINDFPPFFKTLRLA